MLYGSRERQEIVLREAQKYAESIDATLIFGAMVGSISKDLQYADSDYDTRFLYLRRDFPENICIPVEMTEDELVKRYYPEGEVFEWIPFWEATSFLQFLVTPSFKDDFSVGLYHVVGWTFQSPYVWDPYGLQGKLVPLLQKIFRGDYEVAYHKTVIGKYWDELQREEAVAKNYLYAVHAAASIEWSVVYGEQPPVDLQTLLLGLGRNDVWAESRRLLDWARREAREAWDSGTSKLESLHFKIRTQRNPRLLAYIDEFYHMADQKIQVSTPARDPREVLSCMYEIIYHSVFEGEPLQYVGKSEKGPHRG